MTELGVAPAQSEGRSRSGLARPGPAERAVAFITVLFLIIGFPPDWFRAGRGELVAGESPLVAVAFLALIGALSLFMMGNWHVAWRVVARSRFVLAFHALMLASMFWSYSPFPTLRRSLAITLAAMVAVHLIVRFTQLEIFRLLAWAMLSALGVNLLFLAAFPNLSTAVESRSGLDVVTGVFANKNGFGQMTFLAIFIFAVAIRADRRWRLLWIGATGLAVYLVILSQSKTALATAGLGVVLLICFQAFRSRKTMFGAVVLSVVGASIGSVVFTIANLEFITNLLGRDPDLSGRVPLWEDVIATIWDRPVLGHGWAAFWNGWFSPAHEIWIEHRWLPPGAHNGFLDYAIQLGVIGFVIGIAMHFRALRRGALHAQNVPGIFGLWPLGVVAISIVYSMSETLVGRNIFWTLTVMAMIVVDQPIATLALPTPARARILAESRRRRAERTS